MSVKRGLLELLVIVLLVFKVGIIIAQEKFSIVDLQPKANQDKTGRSLHNDSETGNDLAELKEGEQTLAGVKFTIGKKIMQLKSTVLENRPSKIEGIKVDKKFRKLHILHATGYGNAAPDNPAHVPNGTTIGKYIIHYADMGTIEIPIVYGADVVDWWGGVQPQKFTKGKVAWTGSNQIAKQGGDIIRLYLTSWQNPSPEKEIATIDFISTSTSAAAPFCVAMTLEE